VIGLRVDCLMNSALK